jgi:hypothetical protein
MFPRNDSLPSGLVESLEQFGSNDRDRSEALEKFSDVQLLEWCRRLGLQGLSSLNKSQLARRLLQTIAARRGDREVEDEKRAQELAASASVARGNVARSNEPQVIPWGYDKNRVTANYVDPRRMFVYWEIRDDALASARSRLGGSETWLNLRVYDTTERLFDGTNANSYFDQRVERHDRQWFFEIGKPASTSVVELGVKNDEGHFVVVCRSGRVDFPRNKPVEYGAPEWMLVKASTGTIEQRRTDDARGEGHGGGGPGAGPGGGGSEPPWGDWQPGEEPFPAWRPAAAAELRWVRQWRENDPGIVWEEFFGQGGETVHRSVTWQDATTAESWESGPFSYPVQVVPPTYETFEGPGHAWRVGEQVHVMHGPWQVVIRGLGSYVGRRVVSRWEVYRSWSQVTRVESAELGAGAAAAVGVGSSERYLGASMGQSELRLRGASEVFFLGASERRLGGASEYAYRGASEWLMRGASERRLGGSSEYAFRGASERRLGGSSEYGYSGASERRLGGSSEGRLLGGSEGRLGGASERHAPEQGASAPYDSSSVSWATIAVPLADDDDIPWNAGESGTSNGRK